MHLNPNSRPLRFGGLLLGALVWLANSSNPPTGYTGAPFDSHCNNCHSGGNYSGDVTIDGLPGTIAPGANYNLTLRMTASSGNPLRGGFQLVVVDGNDANAGNLTAGAQSGTEFGGSREYLEQRGSRAFSANSISWPFTWQAPASAAGNEIRFYFIGNFCNGNSGSNGDLPLDFLTVVPFSGTTPLSCQITNSTNVNCNGGNDGSATVTASGGSQSYTYLWSNGQNQATAVNLTAGTYTVTVTGGGTATASVVITQPQVLNATATPSGQLSCNNPFVNVTANASGGTPPYSYQWSNGANGNPAAYGNTGAGSVVITDINGCSRTANFTISGNTTPPNAVASANNSFTCTTTTMTLSGTGSSTGTGIVYQWFSSGGGNIISGGNTLTPTVSGCGTYLLQVTNNANGCTATDDVTPTCNTTQPNLTATGGVVGCTGAATLSATSTTPGVTYAWAGPGGFTSNLPSPSVTATGSYTVTVTNPSNGCTRSATVSVTSNATPPGATATAAAVTCASTAVSLSGSSPTAGVTYAWSGPGGYTSSQQNPSAPLSGGPFVLVVTNPTNGCTSSATATPVQNTNPPGATASGGALTCATPSLTLAGGSPTTGVTYRWNGPNGYTSTQQNPTVSVAGNYILTTTNPTNSCTSTATAVVSPNNTAPGASATGGAITCANTSVTLTGTSGTTGVSYAWSGPNNFTSNQQNPTVSAAGTYTLVVTNPANGCTSSATATVSPNNASPGASAAGGTLTCANTSINLAGGSSTTGVNYAWSGPNNFVSTQQNPSVVVPGTYNLVVTNPANGCVSAASTTVQQNIASPGASATGGTITCVSPSVNLTGSSTTNGVVYAWAGPNNYTSTQQNPTVSTAGTYTLVVLNPSNGCTSTATAVVSQNNALPGAGASNGTLTCVNTAVSLGGTSNTTGVSYAWSGPNNYTSAQQNPSVSIAGTYTLVVTNPANSCTSTATAVISQNTVPPGASASGGTITCASSTINLAGSSPTSGVAYAWSGPNNYTATQQNPSVTVSGTYTLVVTNPANGCTSTAVASVSQSTTLPGASAAGGTLTCATTAIALAGASATPGISYAWAGPNGFVSTEQNPTVAVAGSYVLVVSNPANGCTSSATALVASNITAPTVNIAPPGSLHCNASTVLLDASTSSQGPEFAYLWSTANGNIQGPANAALATASAPGLYQLLVTNTLTGCTAATTATVAQVPPLAASAVAVPVLCNGNTNGSVSSSVAGGSGTVTYLWSNNATSAGLQNVAAGTYTVTAVDGNGCSATASATVTQPLVLVPNASATPQQLAGVNDGTATANPSGGTPNYTFVWSNGQTAGAITGLAPGTYTVTVRDANNCSAIQTVNINAVNCALSIATATTPVLCNGAANGTATVSVSGANGGTTFVWSNGGSTASITNLGPGTYTVTATDVLGCSQVNNASIAEPAVLAANVIATPQTIVGQPNGSAVAAPSGGTPPYAYTWSNGATTAAITGLVPGVYTVSIADANQCQVGQSVTINAVVCALGVAANTQPVSCFGLSNGSANAIVTGGTGNVGYLWNTGASAPSLTGLSAGTYTVSTTDAAGCTATATGTVVQPSALSTLATVTAQPVCPLDATGQVAVENSGGTPPYTLTAPLSTPTGYTVGSYTFSVTDANGCTTTGSFLIAATDAQAPALACPPSSTLCVGSAVFYTAPTATDNCAPLPQVTLVSGQPSGSTFPVGTTTQVFQAVDLNGNSTTCAFQVTITLPPSVTYMVSSDTNNLGRGRINVTATAGSPPYTFRWFKNGQLFSTQEDLSNLSAGTYLLEVTDAAGCMLTFPNIVLDNIVGAKDVRWLQQIALFPNPASDVLHLEGRNVEITAVQICTAQGRLLEVVTSNFGAIPVGHLPAGLYCLLIKTTDGRNGLLKWVKG